jgi:hypothetical protein
VVLASCVCAAACGESTTGTVSTPTVTRTTDTYSGTVVVGGSAFHSFPVTKTGTVDVTLTSASPPATVTMGLSLGMPAEGQCNPLAGATVNAQAAASPQLSALSTAATLCVLIRDVGQQTAPVSYTITVIHP